MIIASTHPGISPVEVEVSKGGIVSIVQDEYSQIVVDMTMAAELHAWLGSVIKHPALRRFLNPDDVRDGVGV